MNQKISRRDWFRLRVSDKNQMADDGQSSQFSVSSDSLKPIEHPPNHDGMDLAQLPPMREATLSAEQVIVLFRDIQQLGTDILLMQRQTDTQRTNASKVESSNQLEMARTALLSGTVPRIQIRYRWQNQQWIDTLKRESDGIHIVRIAHKLS